MKRRGLYAWTPPLWLTCERLREEGRALRARSPAPSAWWTCVLELSGEINRKVFAMDDASKRALRAEVGVLLSSVSVWLPDYRTEHCCGGVGKVSARRVRNNRRPCSDACDREWSRGALRSDHGAAQRDATLQSAAAAHQRAEHRARESGQVRTTYYTLHTTH